MKGIFKTLCSVISLGVVFLQIAAGCNLLAIFTIDLPIVKEVCIWARSNQYKLSLYLLISEMRAVVGQRICMRNRREIIELSWCCYRINRRGALPSEVERTCGARNHNLNHVSL